MCEWLAMFMTIAFLISIGGWGYSSRNSSRRGVLDNTLVIVTADHGEHLGDHLLFFHGCSLYRQLVQVPLVIVDNKGVPSDRVVTEPVSLCDVPATVVDLLGLGRDAPFPGRSLTRFWRRPDQAVSLPAEPLLMRDRQAGAPHEPRPRASRQGPDEVARRQGDALYPHGRRDRGVLRVELRPGGKVQHGGRAECSGRSRAIPERSGVHAQDTLAIFAFSISLRTMFGKPGSGLGLSSPSCSR